MEAGAVPLVPGVGDGDLGLAPLVPGVGDGDLGLGRGACGFDTLRGGAVSRALGVGVRFRPEVLDLVAGGGMPIYNIISIA